MKRTFSYTTIGGLLSSADVAVIMFEHKDLTKSTVGKQNIINNSLKSILME